MSRRYLTQAHVLITAVVTSIALIGCAGNHGGKATLKRSLGRGGKLGAKGNRLGKMTTGDCVNLIEEVKALRERTDGLALHSRDYDLGQISTVGKDHRVAFTTVTDAPSIELRARRALTGGNAPIYRASGEPDQVIDAAPLSDLLLVESQDGCGTVKFKSGVTFTVQHADQVSLNLINPATLEQREYIWFQDNLVINVFAPVELKACDGRPSPAKFERISMRLIWGDQFGRINLVPEYAKILDVAPQTTYAKFEKIIANTAARAEALKCPTKP